MKISLHAMIKPNNVLKKLQMDYGGLKSIVNGKKRLKWRKIMGPLSLGDL